MSITNPDHLPLKKMRGTTPDGHEIFKLHQSDYSLKTDITDEEKQHSYLAPDKR